MKCGNRHEGKREAGSAVVAAAAACTAPPPVGNRCLHRALRQGGAIPHFLVWQTTGSSSRPHCCLQFGSRCCQQMSHARHGASDLLAGVANKTSGLIILTCV